MKKTKEAAGWRRLFVILSFDEGQSIEELARLTRLSPSTIEEYLKEFSSSNKTKNDPRGGSERKLTPEESEKLEKHLAEVTYLKVAPIIAYAQKEFGKTYSRSGMTLWLKEHGFTYKKPKKVPGKANPEAQARFIEEYENLKRTLPSDAEIYFLDAVHPEYQSQAACGWIKKGECKTLQTSAKQQRLHFIGALRLDGMQILTEEYKTIDAEAVIDFLKKIESASSASEIHIILDNARSNKNKELGKYLEQSRIKLHYLPPYSPNLNPIERLWKIFRETTLYNRYYQNCLECFRAMREFFTEKISILTHVLESRITDRFETIRLNPIVIN
ncbi:MAG: IS630 family transposase [Minisyncoccia bacterium]